MLNGYDKGWRIGVFDRSVTLQSSSGEEKRNLTDFEDFADMLTDRLGLAVEPDTLQRLWRRLCAMEAPKAGDGDAA